MIERVIPSVWGRATLWLVTRLWVGYQFLTAGWAKLFGDEQAAFVGSHAGAGIKGFLGFATSPQMTGGAHASVLPPYVWLAQHVFLPAAIPLGYMQPPESVAHAFLFLCSDLASYLTGSVLLTDGGCSLYPMD